MKILLERLIPNFQGFKNSYSIVMDFVGNQDNSSQRKIIGLNQRHLNGLGYTEEHSLPTNRDAL